jgi:hypothetical protein
MKKRENEKESERLDERVKNRIFCVIKDSARYSVD